MKEISTPPAVIRAAETLDELALVINSTYAAAEECDRKGVEHYRQCGLMLVQAKKKCAHGEWLPWLKANVRFSQQRASQCMRLAKLLVTGNLPDEWRAIQGNAPESGEGSEPEPRQPAPVVETVGTDGKDYFVGARKDGSPWVMPKERESPEQYKSKPPAKANPEPESSPQAVPDEAESEPEHVAEEPAPERATIPFEQWHATLPTHEELDRTRGLKPGNNADPDHPFANSLKAMTALVKALNADMEADETGFLKDNLSLFARVNAPLRMVLHRPGLWKEGARTPPCAKFVGLVLLRSVVRETGKRLKKMTPKQIKRLIADINTADESALLDREDAA